MIVGDAGEMVSPDTAVIVIVPNPEALGSATDVAITLTVAGDGTDPGAVNRPLPEMLPHADPLQPVPERLHLTAVFVAPVTLAVNCCWPPIDTWLLAGDTVTVTAVAASMTTLAEAVLEASATEVAVILARAGVGTVAGAIYKPDDVMVPQDPDTQPVPDTDHVTAVLELPLTDTVNCCCPFTAMVAELGDIETPTVVGDPIVTAAVPTSDRSASDVAVTVTVAGLGAVPGAVYSPPELIEPQPIPLQPTPEIPQITTPSAEPLALNCTCAPGFSCAEEGEIVTDALAIPPKPMIAPMHTARSRF